MSIMENYKQQAISQVHLGSNDMYLHLSEHTTTHIPGVPSAPPGTAALPPAPKFMLKVKPPFPFGIPGMTKKPRAEC